MAEKFRDPFPIYKDGKVKLVHSVDYSAWAAHGWTTEPPGAAGESAEAEAPAAIVPPASVTTPPEQNSYQKRKAQLEDLLKEPQGWRHIERMAKELGISDKPKGGWDDAIPAILELEGLSEKG